jgi:hypothetical protein
MSYGTTERVELRKDTKSFNAGITNNVILKEVKAEMKSTKNGDKFVINFTLEGPEGEIFNHTEWGQEEAGKIVNQNKRLRRWINELTDEDSFPTNFISWEDCANRFVAALPNNYSNTKLQIKLTYKDNGYLEMPKYDPTVKNMADNTLRISNSDKVVKGIVVSPSSVEDLGTADLGADDLIF